MIAPTVAPQTTIPSAEARRAAGNRSAATYRESWFEAFPNPMRTVPTSSIAIDPTATARVATNAPATPTP